MVNKVRPFLMFQGEAQAAIAFYRLVFPAFEVLELGLYGLGERGAEGSVHYARLAVAGCEILCVDSPVRHDFTFTPSMSLFVDCESVAEIDALAGALAEGGKVMMPLDDYGFSRRFAWVRDRFGVSWQLNLAA
jgi:predicted 3-demethylubiquinone-9 3-methyltransferase (glyoxalase superfamily)